MKQDLPPPPDHVPKKRRALHGLHDLHVAMLLASDTISSPERNRLELEKARRRTISVQRPVGLLVGDEGVTPQQLEAISSVLAMLDPTEIHKPHVSRALNAVCKSHGVPLYRHTGMREVIKNSQHVIAAPAQSAPTGDGVWELARYAKHRSVGLTVIRPDGTNIGSTT